jgi:hypothetical protein
MAAAGGSYKHSKVTLGLCVSVFWDHGQCVLSVWRACRPSLPYPVGACAGVAGAEGVAGGCRLCKAKVMRHVGLARGTCAAVGGLVQAPESHFGYVWECLLGSWRARVVTCGAHGLCSLRTRSWYALVWLASLVL